MRQIPTSAPGLQVTRSADQVYESTAAAFKAELDDN